jgi:hypothetical protein
MHTLKKMLIAKDMAAEDYIAAVNINPAALNIVNEWEQLEKYVNDLNFKKAREIADAITAKLTISLG